MDIGRPDHCAGEDERDRRDEDATTDMDFAVQRLNSELEDIERLKQEHAPGVKLAPEQLAKIAMYQQLHIEATELGMYDTKAPEPCLPTNSDNRKAQESRTRTSTEAPVQKAGPN